MLEIVDVILNVAYSGFGFLAGFLTANTLRKRAK